MNCFTIWSRFSDYCLHFLQILKAETPFGQSFIWKITEDNFNFFLNSNHRQFNVENVLEKAFWWISFSDYEDADEIVHYFFKVFELWEYLIRSCFKYLRKSDRRGHFPKFIRSLLMNGWALTILHGSFGLKKFWFLNRLFYDCWNADPDDLNEIEFLYPHLSYGSIEGCICLGRGKRGVFGTFLLFLCYLSQNFTWLSIFLQSLFL